MKRWGRMAGAACLLIGALGGVRSHALTDEEIFRDFRFNFINPGARAVGMGGAFIGVGDDATAAQSNPAAMHYISQPQAFVEYRVVRPETKVFRPQTTANFNTVGGVDPQLDAQSVTNPGDVSSVSFLSFAYPFLIGERRARAAFSYQSVLDYTTTLADAREGTPDDPAGTTMLRFSLPQWPAVIDPQSGRLVQYSIRNTVVGNLDADLIHYNASFSYGITKDFSIGLTGTYARLKLSSDVTSTSSDPNGVLSSVNPRLDTGAGGLSDIVDRTMADGTDGDVTGTIGLHWHPDSVFREAGYNSSPFRFGLVYRRGAELSVPEVACELDPLTKRCSAASTKRFDNVLKEPDRFGFGMGYEVPTVPWRAGSLTLALDVERIQFSDLLKGFRQGENFFTSARIPIQNRDQIEPVVDDATVVHLGAEAAFRDRSSRTYTVRVGGFNAPDNRIRLENFNTGSKQVDRTYEEVFAGDESVNHGTVGVSFDLVPGLTIQAAGDFSRNGNEFVGSAIYRIAKGKGRTTKSPGR